MAMIAEGQLYQSKKIMKRLSPFKNQRDQSGYKLFISLQAKYLQAIFAHAFDPAAV
jgi:hypothetical protein